MPTSFDKYQNSGHEIDRSKIRYVGIGPWLKSGQGRDKLWPRDSMKVEHEVNQILNSDIKKLINNEEITRRIEKLMSETFGRLISCHIAPLFDKCCPCDKAYFDKVTFDIHHALECFTTSKQVLNFIHHVIRSINRRGAGENKNLAKLFGCNKNFAIFKRHLKELICRGERFHKLRINYFIGFYDVRIDLDKVTWLEGLNPETQYRVFSLFIKKLLNFILEILRRYFYITVGTHFWDKLFYFRYDLWQKIQEKQIKNLIDDEVLLPIRSQAQGNNQQRPQPQAAQNLTSQHNPDPKSDSESRSKFRFHLKKDGLRLICTQKKLNTKTKKTQVAILRSILRNSPNYFRFNLSHLLLGLRHFRDKMIEGGASLYFVRADIKNCFQSINQQLLCDIIIDKLRSIVDDPDQGILTKKLKCFTKERRLPQGKLSAPKWVDIYTMDENSVRNNRKYSEVKLVEENLIKLRDFRIKYLEPNIMQPVLSLTSNSLISYKLEKGIRQGSQLSPLYNSIYIQAALDHYLSEYFASPSCRIYHYVDDILFISTDLEMAQQFMHIMLTGFPRFNLKVNIDKLASNFPCVRLDSNLCRLEDSVVFYKQRIKLDSLRCSYEYNYNDMALQNTFALNPYANHHEIDKSMQSIRIEPFHLDVKLNGFDQVVRNIFERALLIAHRVSSWITTSINLKNLMNQDPDFLLSIIKSTTKRICITILKALHRQLIENDLVTIEVLILVSGGFLATWNRKHVRHRKLERQKLRSFYRRRLMRIELLDCMSEERLNYWRLNLSKLFSEFKSGPLAKQFELPHSRHWRA